MICYTTTKLLQLYYGKGVLLSSLKYVEPELSSMWQILLKF